MEITAKRRMNQGDYTVVLFRQTLQGAGDARPLPTDWLDLVTRFDQSEFNPCWDLAGELFGKSTCGDGTTLHAVDELTLKESTIAASMDKAHTEKVNLIRPLREKLHADADARWERRQARWTVEYQEILRQREAEREKRIASAVIEATVVSAEDRAWAAGIGLSLD